LGALSEPVGFGHVLTRMASVAVEGWCSAAKDCFNASKPAGSSEVRSRNVPLWRVRP
jgi:hypothetical protein